MGITIRKISFVKLALLFLLLSMYSCGTISSMRESWTITMVLLGLSMAFWVFNFLILGMKKISVLEIPWFVLTLSCIFGAFRGVVNTMPLFYTICLIMLLTCGESKNKYLLSSLKWFDFFGVFFAFGCYWQYLFQKQYYKILFPLFSEYYQQNIRRQFTYHKMCTGFTSQTVITAGFIILGIMSLLYTYSSKKTKIEKFNTIIKIVFMSGGLLLTGKRSPLLNISAAIIVVDMITVKRGKKTSRFLGILLGIVVALLVLYFAAPLFSDTRNSITRIFEYANKDDVSDVANGRLVLYMNAFKLFLEHPIIGVGWGRYSQMYDISGAHNIYLQLLCECGVVGALLCMMGIIFVLFRTIKMLKKSTNYNSLSDRTVLLKCSVFIQVYILVYGMFGNPIYDRNYLLMYFIGVLYSVMISVSSTNEIEL